MDATAKYEPKHGVRAAFVLRRLALMFALLVSMACKLVDNLGGLGVAQVTAEATAEAEALPGDGTPATPQPAVSPTAGEAIPDETSVDTSGLTLVYTKDGGLWRWQNGRSEALPWSGQVFAPRLSPDGQVVAFLRPADEFHIELWAVNLDGTNERKLVSVSDLDAIAGAQRDASAVAINPYTVEWIPGAGQRRAFNTHQVYKGRGLGLLDDLHIIYAVGGQLQTVLAPGSGGEFVFSPDGS